MTPMIDTLLQLFVVFMLNMSFVMSTVPLKLPRASAQPVHPATPVVVSVQADRTIYLGAEQVSLRDLSGLIRSRLQQVRTPDVVLKAERSLPYEAVIDVVLALKDGGAETVNLAYEEAR